MKQLIQEEAKIIQIGNTTYLRLSPVVRKVAGVSKGDNVKITATENEIVVEKGE